MEISKKTTYERLPNGIDIHVLKTSAKDIVVSKIGIKGGKNAIYENPIIAILLDEILPGGTHKKNKHEVLDAFESLGARVGVSFTHEYIVLTLSSRSKNFIQALSLLVETIIQPSFSKNEFDVAKHKVMNQLLQARENTEYQSSIALKQLLFRRGHPHWSPSNKALLNSLKVIETKELKSLYKKTISSTGALAVIVGDVKEKDFSKKVARILSSIPQKKTETPVLHPDNVRVTKENDVVISIRDNLNVDTFLGIPLMITTDASDYFDFLFGVNILGRSSTSRLFNIMRTKENLTYGASAGIVGAEGGYPPYLKCWTILPNEVFLKGRNVMRGIVRDFVDMGVTPREVKERKEELIGKYSIVLSTTTGLCGEMFAHVMQQKSLREIDTFSDTIESMTVKKINGAIQTHINYTLAKTAAAGAVRADGTPIT